MIMKINDVLASLILNSELVKEALVRVRVELLNLGFGVESIKKECYPLVAITLYHELLNSDFVEKFDLNASDFIEFLHEMDEEGVALILSTLTGRSYKYFI